LVGTAATGNPRETTKKVSFSSIVAGRITYKNITVFYPYFAIQYEIIQTTR
jgi:hypothetical protein